MVVEDYDIMVTVMTVAWISMLELTAIVCVCVWGGGGGRKGAGRARNWGRGGGVVEDYDIMVTVMTAAWISMLDIGDYTLWCSRKTKLRY